jgi:hypothetical protein
VQVLEQSSALAKKANRLNAKMYTKAASETLEATRGFNMRDSVRDLQRKPPPTGTGSNRQSVMSPGMTSTEIRR